MAVGPGLQGLEDVGAQRREAAGRARRERGFSAPPAIDRNARLLAEARWIGLALLVAALAAVMLSYHRDDPGFTNVSSSVHVRNWGGSAGAWLADLMFFLFGFSACLWVLFVGAWVVREFVRLHRRTQTAARLSRWVRGPGFVLLLLSATTLESLRLQSLAGRLPGAAGGLLGSSLGPWILAPLGITGATVALLAGCAIGASLAFGFSWLAVAEGLGGALETVVGWARARREAEQDRTIGEAASEERAATFAAQRERLDEHEPVHIERQAARVALSERKQRERQVPLFAEAAASGLPALDLLDEPDAGPEAVSTETLE
ncbi:MAG TPA: DNA translocase FtsK 4TM domain-containing protein, partial [Burkholderiaceae bacterium]|nr:DNA translocase FtsK 4TM domain-containing protein [Burkholderiaceae bacterium]